MANSLRTKTREFLTAEHILNSPRDGTSKAAMLGKEPKQHLLIKEEIQNQMVRLRDAFLRIDQRIEGTVPRYMIASCLRAGGMELPPKQLHDAQYKYMTGDGRFNWERFCNDVERARNRAWSDASRLKTAHLFKEVDKDGSGRLGKEELAILLDRMNVKVSPEHLTELFQSFDEDGDGNLDFSEFLDGLATNMVSPSPVWDTVQSLSHGPKKQGGGGLSPRNSPRNGGKSPRVTPGFFHG